MAALEEVHLQWGLRVEGNIIWEENLERDIVIETRYGLILGSQFSILSQRAGAWLGERGTNAVSFASV